MEKWEYKVCKAPSTLTQRETALNELGQQGWELVCVTCIDGNVRFYLKRKLVQ